MILRQLGSFADRLAEPAILKVKQTIRRLSMAILLLALGVVCLVLGISYLASSLWYALVPVLGPAGADLLLGGVYVAIAVPLLLGGSRLAK